MGKDTGSIRGQAKRLGLTLSKLPNGGIASGGKYKYAIRGDNGRVNMRAGNLKEARGLISSVRQRRREQGTVMLSGPNTYGAYMNDKRTGFTVHHLRGTFTSKREAQRFVDRGLK